MTIENAIDILVGEIETNTEEQNEALDFAIDVMRKTKWIPVTERLPNDGQRVLLSSKGGVELVTWDEEIKRLYRDFGDVVTAWMSLPEPYGGMNDE